MIDIKKICVRYFIYDIKDYFITLEVVRIRGVARGGGHGRMSPPVREKRKKFVMIKK